MTQFQAALHPPFHLISYAFMHDFHLSYMHEFHFSYLQCVTDSDSTGLLIFKPQGEADRHGQGNIHVSRE